MIPSAHVVPAIGLGNLPASTAVTTLETHKSPRLLGDGFGPARSGAPSFRSMGQVGATCVDGQEGVLEGSRPQGKGSAKKKRQSETRDKHLGSATTDSKNVTSSQDPGKHAKRAKRNNPNTQMEERDDLLEKKNRNSIVITLSETNATNQTLKL
jgi:hypothetical protein